MLAGQLAYYRARAAEYDATSYRADEGDRDAVAAVAAVVADLAIRGDVLELAGGTGVWTRELARTARSVHYVDGAPEMCERARARVHAPDVDFEVADVFGYRPARRYD